MEKIPCIAILIMALMFTLFALADEKDLYIDRNVQSIFTSEDGLLSTSTQAVAQTSEGFIWIGGYGGLVRYDGKAFETFAYKRITRISDLAAGEDGVLWVATSDKGLFKYADNDFTAIPAEDGEALLNIECLATAPDGTLYLGSGSGLCVVVDDRIHRLDIPELNGELIDRMICPSPDKLFCVTHAGCLFLCDGASARQVAMDGEHVIRSVCYNESDGGCLAGTSGNEVLVFDGAMKQTDTLVMEGLSCINDLHRDDSGALWLCADNGIAIYVDHSVRMQNLLMDNSVDRMLVDCEGNYWFVSSRQGVLEVSRSKFGDVSNSAGLDSMVVNAVQRVGDTLYIGHDAGMAAISANDFKQLSDPACEAMEGVRVRALLTDSKGNLWIGTMKKGLFRYAPSGEMVNYTSEAFPELLSDNVRSIVETDDGILIGTDKGAFLVDDNGVRNVLNDPSLLAFRVLCAGKFGDTFYLGSDGNGLFLVKDGEIVRRVTTEDGMSSDVIMKEYWSDAMDGAWLVTGNNLDFLHSDGTVDSIDFPSTNNLDLKILPDGETWLFTGCGIYRTTENALLNDKEPKYLPYRHVDGLPYEVTPNSYQCFTDGLLYVCGSGGVFTLQMDDVQSDTVAYRLDIDSLRADGQSVYIHPNAPVEIDDDVKRVDINAYVLTYQTGNPFVFYYLEGFDKARTVSQLSALGDISYTNLNGGSYTFHFGILDYRTDDVVQEITLPIVKKYAWYEDSRIRVAALLAGLLLLALITLLIIRIRSRRIARALKQEYEKKERMHLQRIAYQDYLTGLYNRNYLDVWNSKGLLAGEYPVTFVSIDMNDLKKINDNFGHKEGDQLLCAMANLLKRHFAGKQYTVFRIGGDEFLVLARGVDGEQVRLLLDRMAAEGAAGSGPTAEFVNGIPVTFGYGLCTQREGEFNFDEGLRLSDLRMLEDKNRFHGRG